MVGAVGRVLAREPALRCGKRARWSDLGTRPDTEASIELMVGQGPSYDKAASVGPVEGQGSTDALLSLAAAVH
ncbi:MAG: hypothetical protein ABS96_22990 [Lysobacteraceae bacterium SCN 69-123]|nr:MAG: hypothetical protein ABS96_22990 [Xanthomonadaceae bacterium SCN 69-123]